MHQMRNMRFLLGQKKTKKTKNNEIEAEVKKTLASLVDKVEQQTAQTPFFLFDKPKTQLSEQDVKPANPNNIKRRSRL